MDLNKTFFGKLKRKFKKRKFMKWGKRKKTKKGCSRIKRVQRVTHSFHLIILKTHFCLRKTRGYTREQEGVEEWTKRARQRTHET